MNIARYYRTIKHLKLSQIFYRLYFYYYRPKAVLSAALATRNQQQTLITPIPKLPRFISEHEFSFATQTKNISKTEIWNDKHIDKLWLYNLHYFDICGDISKSTQQQSQLMLRWITENPPAQGCGWEPYPLSLRIVNWIKWSLQHAITDNVILQSLTIQARYLNKRLEYHLLGNHLFTNAKALVFAGLFFSGNEAEVWLRKGLAILNEQLQEQILADGGHFERSPMYHAIILEDILDLINVLHCYNKPISQVWVQIIQKMFFWLNNLLHPDDDIAFFNDSAFKIASSFQALLDYVKRLGIEIVFPETLPLQLLAASGFARAVKENALLLADVGSVGPHYIPGHAHAGTLGFELSLFQQRILVNSGISSYSETPQRYSQRSTAAHNTMMIGQDNSSEVWNSFRVGRRAQILETETATTTETIQLRATHNGYRHLKGKPLHTRQWYLQAGKLLIVDEISGDGEHEINQFFHFYPELQLQQTAENRWQINMPAGNVVISLDEKTKAFLKANHFHPEFGIAQPNNTLLTQGNFKLPVRLQTLIEW